MTYMDNQLLPCENDKIKYTEDDNWLSMSFKFENDINFQSINSKDIISSYALILNNKRELLMYYLEEWKLPGGHLNQNNQLIDIVREQTGVFIRLEKIIGVKLFKSDLINKYSTFYLASVVDNNNELENLDFSFDFSFDSDSTIFLKYNHETVCYFKFTKLINLSIYKNNKLLFDNIYNKWKLQLIIDIDLTLLESARLTNFHYGEDNVTINDALFTDNYAPDEIIKLGNHFRYIWLRPYVHEFLQAMKNLTLIHYWTAGIKECQQAVLNSTQLIDYAVDIYYRDSCSLMDDGYPYKSIVCLNHKLKNEKHTECYFDPKKTLLVDDSSINKVNNDDNCYLISPWRVVGVNTYDLIKSFEDKQLLDLIPLIKNLSDQIIHDNLSIQKIIREEKEFY